MESRPPWPRRCVSPLLHQTTIDRFSDLVVRKWRSSRSESAAGGFGLSSTSRWDHRWTDLCESPGESQWTVEESTSELSRSSVDSNEYVRSRVESDSEDQSHSLRWLQNTTRITLETIRRDHSIFQMGRTIESKSPRRRDLLLFTTRSV